MSLQLVETCSWATLPLRIIRSQRHSAIWRSRHLGPCVGASSSSDRCCRPSENISEPRAFKNTQLAQAAVEVVGWWWHNLALGARGVVGGVVALSGAGVVGSGGSL